LKAAIFILLVFHKTGCLDLFPGVTQFLFSNWHQYN
jgi:hypothetical protein